MSGTENTEPKIFLKYEDGKISQLQQINTPEDLQNAIKDLQSYKSELSKNSKIVKKIKTVKKGEFRKKISSKLSIDDKIEFKIYDDEKKIYRTVEGIVCGVGKTTAEIEYLDLKSKKKIKTKIKYLHDRIIIS